MKMNKYSILRWFIIAICALPLMSAGCEKGDDGDDYGSGSGSNNEHYTNYYDINITRCERVGSVLQVDYIVTNKKNSEIEVNFHNPEAYDNNGTSFSCWFSFGNNEYNSWDIRTKIPANGTIEGHAKVLKFDPSNEARSAKLKWEASIVDIRMYGSYFEKGDIKFTDNRIMSHGIQTNDTKLAYTLKSCKRDGRGNVVIDFTMKNNTGAQLTSVDLGDYWYRQAYDNLGKEYEYSSRWGTEGDYVYGPIHSKIAAGGSASISLRVEKVSASATEITLDLACAIDGYIPSDENIHFITIPIQ